MSFSLTHTDSSSKARLGTLKTRCGEVQTPFFMPVATFATGRGIGPDNYNKLGVQSIISNAFLLSLKPGINTVKEFDGLHKFMNFKGCIFTDSGGFQSSNPELFLQASRKGIHLKSPYDGSRTIMTPKRLVEIQVALGSDVAMVIDDMAPADATEKEFTKALNNTHRWAQECKEHHTQQKVNGSNKNQMLFAIVQGGYSAELRKESAETLKQYDFDGYGIGGCAIGEPKPDMYRAVQNSTPFLPEDKPRYLMGVGSPPDVVCCIGLGVDCFDSIFPTQNARHNRIFTKNGPYQVEKAKFALDTEPLEKGCSCSTCTQFSRGYIRHLSTVNESEGARLRQVHNIYFMMQLIEGAKRAIAQDTFKEFQKEFLEDWFTGNIPDVYKNL